VVVVGSLFCWQLPAPSQVSGLSQGVSAELPQLDPLGLAGSEQTPVLVLQVPASWHSSDATQVTGAVVSPHTPAVHVFTPLHAFPSSLHDAPSAFAGFEQTPVDVLQVPAS
jgi:hypothetical protein